MRREGVVRQGFPVGEHRAAQVRRKKRNLFHQALGGTGIGRDDGRGFAAGLLSLPQSGQQQGIGGTDRLGQGVALADKE